jgi:hypothetical protein
LEVFQGGHCRAACRSARGCHFLAPLQVLMLVGHSGGLPGKALSCRLHNTPAPTQGDVDLCEKALMPAAYSSIRGRHCLAACNINKMVSISCSHFFDRLCSRCTARNLQGRDCQAAWQQCTPCVSKPCNSDSPTLSA